MMVLTDVRVPTISCTGAATAALCALFGCRRRCPLGDGSTPALAQVGQVENDADSFNEALFSALD
jgi:hypothetical protein